MARSIVKKSLQGRYQILLATLMILFVVTPFFEISFLVDLVVTIVFFLTLTAVAEEKKLLIVAFLLALTTVSLTWLSYIIENVNFHKASQLLDLVFVFLIVLIILRKIFTADRVTKEVVSAAVCVYLLIGLFWAELYILLVLLEPNSFANIVANGQNVADIRYGSHVLTRQFTYFSFVTLSTLGYGDITPITQQAKALASMEAIVGQLYIAVLIARLVSQQVTHSKK